MTDYFIYTNQGQIISTGRTPQPECLAAPSGCTVGFGPAEIGAHYVVEGELIAMPTKPGEFYTFNYETKSYEFDSQKAEAFARLKRQKLLSESDWTQLPDVPLVTKEAWATYRQALRDITDQPDYPLSIIWPDQPPS